MSEVPFQTRGGQRFHKGDFFYAPSDDPSTWKLLKSGTPGGEPDAVHVGAAVAALGKGYRGETVDIPDADKPAVIRRVRAAWKKLHPGEDVPETLQAGITVAAVSLRAVALNVPETEGHPNAIPFRGVLTRVGIPSDGAPAGAEGHRVLLPRDVAESALPSLLGMGVGIDSSLERHNPRVKVGIITEAVLDGDTLAVAGILYAKDFPREVAEIQRLARQNVLGMSFELSEAVIADNMADIWVIQSCIFTGAAILAKARAAYRTTALAAQEEESTMADEEHVTTEITAIAERETPAHSEESPTIDLAAGMDTMMQTMNRMAGNMAHFQACMNAMDRLVGMRAGLDSLTEALEHLVQMHEALHKADMPMDDVEGGMRPMNNPMHAEEGTPMTAQDDKVSKLEAMVADLAASVKLLTDQQQEMNRMITDTTPPRSGLVTDRAPARATMAANGEYHQFVSKYGIEASEQYNEVQVDTLLRDAGITDAAQRMAVKMAMQRNGKLVA